MKNIIKFLVALIFTLLFFLQPITAFAGTSTTLEDEISTIDYSDIVATSTTPTIISFSEKDYGKNSFAIYTYVYSNGVIFSENKNANCLNIAFGNDNYNNVALTYVSKTADGSVYKFSLDVKNSKFSDDVAERKYKVASLQLLTQGENLATDYNVGKIYIYTGNGEDLRQDILETVEIEVHQAYYRMQTGTSLYSQHQVDSVYFSIPNEIVDKYDELTEVRAEWYEYRTAPAVVIYNEDYYNKLLDYKDVYVGYANSNIPNKFGCFVGTSSESNYLIGYNTGKAFTIKNIPRLTYLFYKDSQENATVSREQLKQYIYNYQNIQGNSDYLDIAGRVFSAHLFEETENTPHQVKDIKAKNLFDLISYTDTISSWQKFVDYGLFKKIPEEDSIKQVSPIKKLTDDDFYRNSVKNETELLINQVDGYSLYNYYNIGKNNNSSTYLLHFAVSDYERYPVKREDYGFFEDWGKRHDIGYVSQETVYLNFDVISLKFEKDNVPYVIPVTSSPIDVISPLTPPPTVGLEDWVYALMIVGGIVVFVVIYRIFKKE